MTVRMSSVEIGVAKVSIANMKYLSDFRKKAVARLLGLGEAGGSARVMMIPESQKVGKRARVEIRV